MGNVYACRTTNDGRPLWVSQTCARKGSKRALRDGVDWGWTFHSPGWRGHDAPLLLSPYWLQRLRATARFCQYEITVLAPVVKEFYPEHCADR